MTRGQFLLRLSFVCTTICGATTVVLLRTQTSLTGFAAAVTTIVVSMVFFVLFGWIVTRLGW